MDTDNTSVITATITLPATDLIRLAVLAEKHAAVLRERSVWMDVSTNVLATVADDYDELSRILSTAADDARRAVINPISA